jgi:hypothetical protein
LMFKVITHYWTGLMIIEYCVVFFIWKLFHV